MGCATLLAPSLQLCSLLDGLCKRCCCSPVQGRKELQQLVQCRMAELALEARQAAATAVKAVKADVSVGWRSTVFVAKIKQQFDTAVDTCIDVFTPILVLVLVLVFYHCRE